MAMNVNKTKSSSIVVTVKILLNKTHVKLLTELLKNKKLDREASPLLFFRSLVTPICLYAGVRRRCHYRGRKSPTLFEINEAFVLKIFQLSTSLSLDGV
jgi:hypothetical protein